MNTPGSSPVSSVIDDMRTLENGLNDAINRSSTLSSSTRTTNTIITPIPTISDMDIESEASTSASTSSKVVRNTAQGMSGKTSQDGGTQSLLTNFRDQTLQIQHRLRVESFEEPITPVTATVTKADNVSKRPRTKSGDTHNHAVSWADIVNAQDESDQPSDLDTGFAETNVSSRGDKDVRKYITPQLLPFYSDARNCLIKQGRQEIRNDFYQKCIDEDIIIHELTVTPILPQGITLDPHEKARWSQERVNFEAKLMSMLKEKGVNTHSQYDRASNKALAEFQHEMDRTNLPLTSVQKAIDILVEKVGNNKASYRLVLTKQFMEIRKECNLFRKEHNFLSRRVPLRDQRPKAPTQGSPERRPSPRRPTPLVSPPQQRGPQYQRFRSRSPRAPVQRNRRSPSNQNRARANPQAQINQNSQAPNRDDRIMNLLENMSSRLNRLERSTPIQDQPHQINRTLLTARRPSQQRGRSRGQRGGRR